MMPWSDFTQKDSQFRKRTAPKEGINLKNIHSLSFMLCFVKELGNNNAGKVMNDKF
jgi:hypothetical protein